MRSRRQPQFVLAAAVLFSAICLISCEPGQDPIAVTDFTIVEAVLQIGPSEVQVRIRGNDPQTTATPTPVLAVIKSSTGDSTIALRTNVPDIRLASIDSTFLVPGRSYSLRVQMSNGRVITGTTTMPNKARPPIDTVTFHPRDTLRLSWPRVQGAAGYQLYVNENDQFGQEPVYTVFTDTSIILPGTKRNLDDDAIFVPGRSVYVSVAAVDRNYLEYYRQTVDPFAGIPPTHLSGGIGVFGAVVNIVRKQVRVIQ